MGGIVNTLKEHVDKLLIALAVTGFAAGPIYHSRARQELEKSGYVTKAVNSIGISYYGFDDDGIGGIDRIEETGVLPSSRTVPIPIRRTHRVGEPDFDFYLNQINGK